MILSISNKDKFLNNFLIPVSRVAESAVLNINNESITSLIATSDNTVIVNAHYSESKNKSVKKLNIPDIKKLCRILQCIDEQDLELKLETNNISYRSHSIKFKYHLFDDNIIPEPKLNLSKLDKLDFSGNFTITQGTVSSLIKGSTIATETNKIYISFNDKEVFGELTDKARANTDSYGLKISTDYSGAPILSPIPLNFEIFRIISSMKFTEIKSKVAASTGVFVFDMATEEAQLKFIISALAN
jgi:hypothetical protein